MPADESAPRSDTLRNVCRGAGRSGIAPGHHIRSRRVELRLATGTRSSSGVGSEEENMPNVVLSNRAAKLKKLCELEGFRSIEELARSALSDAVCPAICMADGCDYTTEMEPDQRRGYCEACGRNTVVSGLVLAGII
jgi:hypothetical protein